MICSPHVWRRAATALDCLNRADALDREHRHDEERCHVPGKANDSGDDRSENAGTFRDRSQNHADCRGDERVADDLGQARECNSKAVAEGRIPSIKPDQRSAHRAVLKKNVTVYETR